MSDDFQPIDEVAKRRKGLVAAVLAILLVVAAIVAAMYLLGFGPFAADSAEPAAQTTTPVTQQATADEAEEETSTAEASESDVALPPADAQEAMYWEQVSSAPNINDLVDNKFASFELSQVTKSSNLANIRVKAIYRDGSTMSGWIVLKQYEGAWYFASIMADGSGTPVAPDLGDPDADIMKAMVEQQAANQDVYAAILDGKYNTIVIDKVVVGSGVRTIEITLSGNAIAGDAAKVTTISKDGGTGAQWFITAFSM
jgi:hypothetical protein